MVCSLQRCTISALHGLFPTRGDKVDSAFFGFGFHLFASPEGPYLVRPGVYSDTRVWDVWTGSLIWSDGATGNGYQQRPAL